MAGFARDARLLVVAGDPSGDAHAARVVERLRGLRPDVRVQAVGGQALKAAGAELVEDLVSRAVVGFTEVIAQLPGVWTAWKRALKAAAEADVVMLVDYPGFNMRLLEKLAALPRRPKILYYIAPQVWAWHKSRAAILARCADRIAVVFPFEAALYPNAEYVGHPLLDLPEPPSHPDLAGDRIVALLPGSRRGEIGRHIDLLAETAALLRGNGWRPILSLADQSLAPLFSRADVEIFGGDARILLAAAERAVVKSGTSTLQAALLGVPFVTIYRLSWGSYALGRLLVDAPRIAMPNILLEETVSPELIQHAATPRAITAALEALDPVAMRAQWSRLRDVLENRGAAERTAGLCAALLESPAC